jgi:hypothetical protein
LIELCGKHRKTTLAPAPWTGFEDLLAWGDADRAERLLDPFFALVCFVDTLKQCHAGTEIVRPNDESLVISRGP